MGESVFSREEGEVRSRVTWSSGESAIVCWCCSCCAEPGPLLPFPADLGHLAKAWKRFFYSFAFFASSLFLHSSTRTRTHRHVVQVSQSTRRTRVSPQ